MFDIRQYVLNKIQEANLHLHEEHTIVNQDAKVFVLSLKENLALSGALSISGLEELQNSSVEALKDLIDTRFRNVLKGLREHA